MDVEAELRARIAAEGSISVADYMAAANAHYYATRDPFGAAGDFITAPEISQMFGELVGLWLADLWLRAGKPGGARYVELGPGRGTLASDALRAMRGAGIDPPIELVETSPVLRAAQRELLPPARWHDDLSTLPDSGPLLVVANEFFDALPLHQFVRTGDGWRELNVDATDDGFRRRAADTLLSRESGSLDGFLLSLKHEEGTIVEFSPSATKIVSGLCERLERSGGAALVIDYGHDRHAIGDTLQAVSQHRYADPWRDPGNCDLTAHVDFQALREAAEGQNVRVCGPIGQGAFLRAMGIDMRAAALAKASPGRTEEIVEARERLTGADRMGRLFRVMALVAPGWPSPTGF